MEIFDYVIIGGGIVGLAIANEILDRSPNARVVVLDKEPKLGLHASGRNSGVLHAGFYYSPDSLKAKLTRDGNFLMRKFAKDFEIDIKSTGKVVVAQNETQISQLQTLGERASANGVRAELIKESDLKKIEPLAKTTSLALWSPDTGVADPLDFVNAFRQKFESRGGLVCFGSKVLMLEPNAVIGKDFRVNARHIINASGLYADKIARTLGFSQNHEMLPFMGLYWYAPRLKNLLKTHIYPTPDPRNPFLGTHLTTTISGDVKIGPTAIPVFGREQYGLLLGVDIGELTEISKNLLRLFKSPHHDMLGLVQSELPKFSRRVLIKQASLLTQDMRMDEFNVKGRPGIRAQLLNVKENRLEMDFIVEGDSKSTHVLNAVSPAWTSSLSFAKYVVDFMSQNRAI